MKSKSKPQDKIPTHFVLSGPLDPDVVRYLMLKDQDPTSLLVVHLHSEGGELESGMAIYEYLRCRPGHVTVIGYGIVASAAVLILAAGDLQLLTPSTFVHIHSIIQEYEADTKTLDAMQRDAENFSALHGVYVAALLRSIMRKKGNGTNVLAVNAFIEEAMKHETQIDADQAVRLGLADGILPYTEGRQL